MKWTSLKLFDMFFHWQIRCNKSCHTNLRNCQILCYAWKWTIHGWNLTSRISRTRCRYKFSYIVSKSDHAGLGGGGRVIGLRLTMLPLFAQYNIIALLPSHEKSFTLSDGFGKSALLWSFEPKNLWRKTHLWDCCSVWKVLFCNAKRNRRGSGVCLHRASRDLLNVLRWKAEEE